MVKPYEMFLDKFLRDAVNEFFKGLEEDETKVMERLDILKEKGLTEDYLKLIKSKLKEHRQSVKEALENNLVCRFTLYDYHGNAYPDLF
jgi:5-bromo-4-chloroindolyl phosphate hydrolysis protein